MDNKKKTSLLDLARASENRVKNTFSENTEKEEKAPTKEKVETKKEEISLDSFNKYFSTTTDYGVGDLNMKIPVSIHKKFKLIAAHTGVPMAKIVSNVLNDFLIANEKEITKILRPH